MPEAACIFDTTVLSNFALIGQVALLGKLYRGRAFTTLMVADEIRRGIEAGYQHLQITLEQLTTVSPTGWLQVLPLDQANEQQLHAEVSRRLDPGEASCLALAISRGLILATDDLAARRRAAERNVSLTGTLGILLRLVREKHLSLVAANRFLAEMVQQRYRSPVYELDDLI